MGASSGNSSYFTQEGQGLGCQVDQRQVGTGSLKILFNWLTVKGKISLDISLLLLIFDWNVA